MTNKRALFDLIPHLTPIKIEKNLSFSIVELNGISRISYKRYMDVCMAS